MIQYTLDDSYDTFPNTEHTVAFWLDVPIQRIKPIKIMELEELQYVIDGCNPLTIFMKIWETDPRLITLLSGKITTSAIAQITANGLLELNNAEIDAPINSISTKKNI